MKSLIGVPILAAMVLATGCATTDHQLVLDAIGPASNQVAKGSPQGTLIVHSALSVDIPSNRRPDHLRHTDYQIFTPDGSLLQAVHNDYDNSWDAPKEVELPAGTY